MNSGKSCVVSFKRMTGFTLIELLMVITILGILSAIALPGYRNYVIKSTRSDGKAMLVTAAAAEEQFFQNNKTYTTDITGGLLMSASSETGKYVLTIAACGTGIATCYSLTATPQGGQASDSKCLNLTLTSAGVKGASGTLGSKCW